LRAESHEAVSTEFVLLRDLKVGVECDRPIYAVLSFAKVWNLLNVE
jgi:hypothetical protein